MGHHAIDFSDKVVVLVCRSVGNRVAYLEAQYAEFSLGGEGGGGGGRGGGGDEVRSVISSHSCIY